MRMFVAVVPPQPAVDHLEEFLAPRQEAEPGFRWTSIEQWHLTLAFLPRVLDRHLDDLADRLERAARRRTPIELAIAGGGAFPDPSRAKVLFAAVDPTSSADIRGGLGEVAVDGAVEGAEELRRLATGARAAATTAGIETDGGRFHPHVTLARTGRPVEASRWLRVLDSYRGPPWRANEITLIESHLGEGPRRRPRYEVRAAFPLGRETAR